MKSNSYAILLLSLSFCTFFINCKKEGNDSPSTPSTGKPTVQTVEASAVTATSFTMGGTVTAEGSSPVTSRGIIFLGDTRDTITSGSGLGTYTIPINNQKPHTSYGFKAFATNASGTAYGELQVVSTSPGVPTVTTGTPISEYDLWKALGTVENTGGASLTSVGICLATHTNPTISDTKYDGEFQTSSAFSAYIFLNANTTYYIRAFATNMYGTAYSNEVTYTTGFAVGLYHQGGVIFYVDATGQHGWIASLQDQSSGIAWSSLTGLTSASSADGGINTTNIINALGEYAPAANLCRNYRGGGYTDWYLPAAGQLQFMNFTKSIPDFPGALDPITPVQYWSSSERTYFDAYSYIFYPNDFFMHVEMKSTLCKVRAVRSF